MADLSGYSDSDLKNMYLQSLSDDDLKGMAEQHQNSWSDFGKSLAGGAAQGVAAIPMVLPNLINQMAAGPQLLGRGVADTIEGNPTNKDFKPWEPFYSSNDVLNMLPPEAQPHQPQSPVGVAGNIAGNIIGAGTGTKVMEGAAGVIEPFSKSGRNDIANRIITQQAANPEQAAQNLQNVPQYVPGSPATGGTASGDLGLIGMEKTVMQNPANYLGDTLQQQNTARTNFMNQVSGDESTIPKYEGMRSNATSPLYEQAKDVNVDPKALGGVLENINAKINEVGSKSDAGQTLAGLRNDIQSAIPKTQETNQYFVDPKSKPVSDIPQSQLVQIYREIRDALNKSGMQPGAYGSAVKGIIKPLNQQLGAALEMQNPKLAEANGLFQQMSTPIDQATNMQTLVPRMTGGTEDLQGQNIFSPAKVGNIMKQGEMKTEYNGSQPLDKALSPEQYQALKALNQDLQRSNAVNTPMVRPPGSNTFSNEASTAALTKSLTGEVGARIPIFKGIYNAQQPKIMDLVANKIISPSELRSALVDGSKESQAKILGAILASGSLTPPMSVNK